MGLEAGGEEPEPLRGPGVRGERDGGYVPEVAFAGAELLEERVAVLAGHRDVAHEDVGRPPARDLERFGRRARGPHLDAPRRQHGAHDGVRAGIIVDDEHMEAPERRPANGWSPGASLDGRLDVDSERDLHGEGRAPALARAVGPDGPAVELDERSHDREPETEATVAPGDRAVGLAEPFEDVRQEAGIDALAGVPDDDARARLQALERDVHVAARRRELHRVRHQVGDHLLQPVRVSENRDARLGQRGREPHTPGFRGRQHEADRGVDRLGHLHRAARHAPLARDDPRDVEQVVDQLRLRPRALFDRAECDGGLVGAELSRAEHAGPREDRRERRPELVRDRGEEFVLRAARLLGTLACRLRAFEVSLPLDLRLLPLRDVLDEHHDVVRPALQAGETADGDQRVERRATLADATSIAAFGRGAARQHAS